MEVERQNLKKIMLSQCKYFKYFNDRALNEIAASMRKIDCRPGTVIMKPSDALNNFYILTQGRITHLVEMKYLTQSMEPFVHGEKEMLTKLYDPSEIKAITKCTYWVINRQEFRECMRRSSENLWNCTETLKRDPFFSIFPKETLEKVKDTLEVEFFVLDQPILVNPKKMYVISNGHLRIIKKIPGKENEKTIKILGIGDHFDVWTEQLGYLSPFYPGVECVSVHRDILLDSESFEDPDDDSGDMRRVKEYCTMALEDLDPIATIGFGSFSKVQLVKYCKDPSKTFALKRISKEKVLYKRQQNHIITERKLLMEVNNPFVIRCYRTFRCERYVYFLSEACLGGDVLNALHRVGHFPDDVARFVTGCVVEGLSYLHSKRIIYRDLKPENLVIDQFGFVKIADLGLSKKLGLTGRTFTCCGTVNYFAPEVILSVGHNRAVDFWSLGIMLYEMLSSRLPFDSTDQYEIFEGILKGFDNIYFFRSISPDAKDLIKKLCRREPTERIGYCDPDDLRNHKYFEHFDWNGLRSMTLPPPKFLIPWLINSSDLTYFDQISSGDRLPAKDDSNWDIDF